jgi:S-adenosylmethionine-diacylglycerol 3-amino-3-carboxypropyl transferase
MDGGVTIGDEARRGAARTREGLAKAVVRAPAASAQGLLERAFAAAFSGLVYPQIWEDPEADLAGLALAPGARIVAIGSGGCNLLSYLTADPAAVVGVDLNHHHVHLIRLKLAAARTVPDYRTFFRLFGACGDRHAGAIYRRHVRDALPPETRAYWDGRDRLFRRRIAAFERNIYREGLLGRFIGLAHLGARALGVDLAPLLEARDAAEQRAYFERAIAPAFASPLVRRITAAKASLFGLGIPPAQYEALARSGGGDMAAVLRRRLEKLACDFPVAENYFAWQAFARRYAPGDAGPLPLYLQSRWFETVRARADRVTIENRSVTDRLAAEPPGAVDAVVLLDAQDWMTDVQLHALWAAITRAAAPGARVLFRTADEPSLLPGRLDEAILARWTYDAEASTAVTARDRSAIYGGVHLYRFAG